MRIEGQRGSLIIPQSEFRNPQYLGPLAAVGSNLFLTQRGDGHRAHPLCYIRAQTVKAASVPPLMRRRLSRVRNFRESFLIKMSSSLSIIIPAFNESARIGKTSLSEN